MKPHKHAELIKAWADGHEVQFRTPGDGWVGVGDYPCWIDSQEYRIKPAEKVVRWLWAYKTPEGFYILNRFFTEAEANTWFDSVPHKKLEYTRQEFEE